MSIRKMISLHPDVVKSGHVNQALGDAVHHAMYCAKMCLSCADACAAETDGHGAVHPPVQRLRRRVRGDHPLGLRRTGNNEQMLTRDARAVRPGVRRMRRRMREARPRALQAVRADVPRMRRGLPQGRGISIG